MITTRKTLGTVAVIAGALLAIACGGGDGDKGGTASPAAKVGAQGKNGGKSAAATKAAAPKVLLNISGKGIKKSAIFTTGPEWQLTYTYDCKSFYGGSGNFIVTQYSDSGDLEDMLVNELDKKGGDTVPVHASAGAHYLEMNSECKWTVKVTG